jgi:hypothetical protein
MFNLKNVTVKVKVKKPIVGTPSIKGKEFRYVITRELGVAGRILLKVYDKLEGRNIETIQGPIKKGHLYNDKLDNSDVLFQD